MSEESQAVDPYELVLTDLRAKRDKIDQAIQAILDLRGGSSPAPTASASKSQGLTHPNDDITGPGAFLGMTIVDAAKKLLAAKRQPIGNVEMAAAFRAGGMGMTSADPVNTIGSVMTRRFNQVGDIVKIGRGTWGLAEWYPGRNFKKKAAPAKFPADDDLEAMVAQNEESNAESTMVPRDQVEEPDPWSPIDGRVSGVFR